MCPSWLRACVESVLWVMPQTRVVADALGVVAICLLGFLLLLGLLCIIYSLYLRNLSHGQGLFQLSYFNGPWIIRITFIVLAIWWGIGEILRLSLLRRKGRVLGALTLVWQENICKCYIVSNLGFAEPCLFLSLAFLLRASLQRTGALSQKWNKKTAGFVLLCCLPMFILQLIVILIGPKYRKEFNPKLPSYFIEAASSPKTSDDIARCTYPLLSTIIIGLFATILTAYLFWLGRRILNLVINKGLEKRVYALVISISSLFPLRVILLGLSVLPDPEELVFDAVLFLAFLSLFCSVVMGIWMLVYLPIADSLSLRCLQMDMEARRRAGGEYDDFSSLIANQSPQEGSILTSPGGNSVASAGRGSVSFHTMENREEASNAAAFVELNLFNPSMHLSPPSSPRLVGWPTIPPAQGQGS